jgi:hypothetical protein
MSVSDAQNLVGEILEPYEWVRKQTTTSLPIQEVWARYWGTRYGTSEFWFAYANYKGKLDTLSELLVFYSKDPRSLELFVSAVARLAAHYDVVYLRNEVRNLAQLDETFNIVHLASTVLPVHGSKRVEPVTIDAIAEDIADLLKQLDEASIEPQIKAFLKVNFVFLQWAIKNYRQIGIDGLSKAYGSVASEFMRVYSDQEPEKKAEPWWGKAKKNLKLIGEGVLWTEKLAGGAEKLLSHADDVIGIIS